MTFYLHNTKCEHFFLGIFIIYMNHQINIRDTTMDMQVVVGEVVLVMQFHWQELLEVPSTKDMQEEVEL
jgi:hypothetical protein